MKNFLISGVLLSSCGLFSSPNNGDSFLERGPQCSDGVDNDEDGVIDCEDDSCQVDAACANNLPTANSDTLDVDEDAPEVFPFSALTGNDVDPEGGVLRVVGISAAQNCQVESVAGTSEFRVTTSPDFFGAASFSYTIEDEGGLQDTASVAITVNPINDAPTARSDSVGPTPEDAVFSIAFGALTSNDTDIDPGDTLLVDSVQDAVNGAVQIVGDEVRFTPTANFSGNASFRYIARDAAGALSDTASVSFTVAPDNDLPAAVNDDNITTDEDAAVDVDPLGNDVDEDLFTGNEQLIIDSVQSELNCTAVINGDLITITPALNYSGPASVEYTIRDLSGATDSAVIFVNVLPIDDVPVAVNDTASTNEDTALLINASTLLADDIEIDGEVLVFVSAQGATNGSVSFNGNNITFTPAPNFSGDASFRYAIEDATTQVTGTVTVAVAAANDSPVAGPDTLAGSDEDEIRLISFAELLSNDTDVDLGDTLTVGDVQSGANGVVTIVGTDVQFTPAPNANGLASFTYVARDNSGADSAPVSVTFILSPANDAPTAGDDVVNTPEDTPLVIDLVGLLLNDADVDGDLLSVIAIENAINGTVTEDAGVFTFTPDADFNGSGSFEYIVSDGDISDTGFVVVAIGAAGDPPTAVADAFIIDEDTALIVSAADLALNDTDPENDPLVVQSVQNAINGAVNLSGGVVTFTPAPNFFSDASFEYTVTDGFFPVVGVVTIDVLPINDAPTADDVGQATPEDVAVTVTLVGADVDGDSLQFILKSAPTRGTLGGVSIVNATTSTVVYTPFAGLNGPDSFTFTAFDGAVESSIQTVSITVEPVNDQPIAVGDGPFTIIEDQPGSIATAALLSNDSDPDFDVVTVSSVQGAVNCTAELSGADVIVTPLANFSGAASFEYTISDGAGGFDSAIVSLDVIEVNDAPVFELIADQATNEDVAFNVVVTGINGSEGGQSVTLSAVSSDPSIVPAPIFSGVAGGVSTMAAFPALNASGSVTITVTAQDDGGTTNGGDDSFTQDFIITVIAVADAPSLIANNVSGDEETAIGLDITTLVTDTDGSESISSVVITEIPAGTIFSAGVLTGTTLTLTEAQLIGLNLTPPANFDGTINLTVTATATEASNGDAESTIDTFTVTVGNVNEPPLAVDDNNVASTNEDIAVNIDAAIVLANDVDNDGGVLSVSSVQNAVNGAVSLAGSTITFTPTTNFSGAASFDYTMTDGQGGFDTANATLTVIAVADAPSLIANNVSGDEDTAIALDITTSVTDTDGSESISSVVIAGIPTGATLSTGNLAASSFQGFSITNFATGATPQSVAVGRFNADAFDDIVTTNFFGNNVSVLLGNGAGGFGARTNFTVGSAPFGIEVGRFNGDAFDDIVVTNFSSNNVSVLLGNGSGGFGAKTDFATGTNPISVAVGRFNGDAFDDLAVTNRGSANVSVLFGNGTGGFGSATNIAVGSQPRFVVVGRFNGDIIDDLAVANQGSNNVSILIGDGVGAFSAPTNFAVGTSPQGIALGDFNADAIVDLAVANGNSSNVSILPGNGLGAFGAPTNVNAAGGSPVSVVVGRFNGDAIDDVVLAAGNVVLLPGNGVGGLGAATSFTGGLGPTGLAVGRFNADGLDDLAAANQGDDTASIFLNRGESATATLTAAQLVGLTLTPPSNFNGAINLTATSTSTEASNGDTESSVDAFTVTVNAVNDAPSFDAIPDQAVNESLSPQQIFIKGIVGGPASATDESAQIINISGTSNTPLVIPAPSLSAVVNGQATLSFQPIGTGTAEITVTVQDDGGTANGGVNVFQRTFTITVSALCGNGIIFGGEGCDDANVIDSDGCDSSCQIEEGFDCVSEPSVCDVLIGDGLIRGGEQCDDGNSTKGDGCDDRGLIEPGFVCSSEPSLCIPAADCSLADYPGAFATAQDFNTGHCIVSFGPTTFLSWQNAQTECEALGGYLAVPESIEENNLILTTRPGPEEAWIGINDIAIEALTNDAGFTRVTGGTTASFSAFTINPNEPDNDGGFGTEGDCAHYNFGGSTWNDFNCSGFGNEIGSYICEVEFNPCGDGVVQSSSEECDDGNNIDGDGCSSTCTEEPGFLCDNNIPADGVNNSVCAPAPFVTCEAAAFPGASEFINDPATGHCLAHFDTLAIWENAELTCEANGGYLVVPNTSAENVLAFSISGGGNAWIGINDVIKESNNDRLIFAQVTGGTTEELQAFSSGEPNGGADANCVRYTGDATWSDLSCDTLARFVCEFELNPCGDGVLQQSEGEECDDGNKLDGDGCDRLCQQEPGVNCLNTTPALGIPSQCFAPNAINELNVPQEADFCNLQFPPETTVLSGAISENIFGVVFEAGVTPNAGASPFVRGEVGFGLIGSDPSDGGWSFFRAFFNTQIGNDDEYRGRLPAPPVAEAVSLSYTYRFTLDGGGGYTYCDLSGAGSNEGLTFESTQLGTMNVLP